MIEKKPVPLPTGVTLNVAFAGDPSSFPVILLHGFPESHRTWRDVVPRLEDRFYLIMPDQRGFGASDLPQEVEAYETEALVGDIFALAEALKIDQFALVGHDWGGAIAWASALRGDPRLVRLAIVNAPHPRIFQASLIDSPEQRLASQYISTFRSPGFEKTVETKGFDWFFDTTFARHLDVARVPLAERERYIADWSRPGAFNAMLNWYRGSRLVVPLPGASIPVPQWLARDFPKVKVPTLVVWGMKDLALLPLQLDGLDELVEDLSVIPLDTVGHFAPWEAGERVAAALGPFLAGQDAATAPAQ